MEEHKESGVEKPVDKTAEKRAEALKILGVTEDQIQGVKAQFGKVSLAWVGGNPYLYRPIRRIELKSLRGLQAAEGTDLEMIAQEKAAIMCVLAPKLDEQMLRASSAGLATTLAELVYQISDFDADSAPIKL